MKRTYRKEGENGRRKQRRKAATASGGCLCSPTVTVHSGRTAVKQSPSMTDARRKEAARKEVAGRCADRRKNGDTALRVCGFAGVAEKKRTTGSKMYNTRSKN